MKGLLIKDLCLLLKKKQNLIVFAAVGIFCVFSSGQVFMSVYTQLFLTIMAVGTVNYDEFDNGFPFLMTLPASRRDYVYEKYILCALAPLAGWLVSIVFMYVGDLLGGEAASFERVLAGIVVAPAIFAAAGIMLPVQLKFGAERGRTVTLIIYAAVLLVFMGISKTFPGAVDGFVNFLDGLKPSGLLGAGFALLAAFTAVSVFCSIRIMDKKEF